MIQAGIWYMESTGRLSGMGIDTAFIESIWKPFMQRMNNKFS